MLERFVAVIVGWSERRAVTVFVASLLISVVAVFYIVRALGMDTDTANMISPDLPWRKDLAHFTESFPQNTGLLVVLVDGATPDAAEDAAALLYERIATRPDLFQTVRRADGGPFFEKYGLLFLSVPELQRLANAAIEAQPFIGSLSEDPSLRGLFNVLALAMEGVARKAASMDRLEKPLSGIAATLSEAMSGGRHAMSWQSLLLNRPTSQRDLHRLILTQPILDFSKLQPGAAATFFIRDSIRDLNLTPETGVKVRLTGPVALNGDEFSTLAEGMGWALLISICLVLLWLFLALRSLKLIAATFAVLAVGLVLTFAFAALTVGKLNLISVAFAVMFIGLSIDFGIQFGVRFCQEQLEGNNSRGSILIRTGTVMARPLTLAAAAIAVGFASFMPTDYRGVSELGLIATAGMMVTLVLNLTLLPALIALLKPSGQAAEAGYSWAAPIDDWLLRYRWRILAAWVIVAGIGLALAPRLEFDFHPLHLKDKNVESMAAILDMMKDPLRSPYGIEILTPDLAAADNLKDALKRLPEIGFALTASSFVPVEQEQKLAILMDLQMLLGLSLQPVSIQPPPSVEEIRAAMRNCAAKIRQALPSSDKGWQLARLLDQAAAAEDTLYPELKRMLIDGLMPRLRLLSSALNAEPLTVDTLPPDIRSQWIAETGEARLLVLPRGDSNDSATLASFVTAVRQVAPMATGPAVQIFESGNAVTRAFKFATLAALAAITLLLLGVLRNVWDAIFALLPLLLAGLMTIIVCVALGLKLDFANIIALPLLLGIGVAFDIYFVINWRRGIVRPLTTSTARAILFSTLATASSFGGLALSSHPGTARMGLLLLIALLAMLASIFGFMPVLMGRPPVAAKGAS